MSSDCRVPVGEMLVTPRIGHRNTETNTRVLRSFRSLARSARKVCNFRDVAMRFEKTAMPRCGTTKTHARLARSGRTCAGTGISVQRLRPRPRRCTRV